MLLRERPNIVYFCVSQNKLAYLRDGIIIILTKLFSRATLIAHLHGNYFRSFYESAGWLTKTFVDATMSKVDVGIVLGEDLARNLDRWVGEIRVIPNGTDVCREGPVENRISERRASRVFVVTFLSSLIESKGIFDFLRAAALVSAEEANIEFRVAGSWGADPMTNASASDTEARANAIVVEEGLRGRVEFLGEVRGSNKERLLLETHVFVLPTFFDEGQPLAILEAMAAGCVVISTAKGAIPETLSAGRVGLIVATGKPEEIARRIIELYRSRDRWSQMALAARKRYEQHYVTERFVERMGSLFSNTHRLRRVEPHT